MTLKNNEKSEEEFNCQLKIELRDLLNFDQSS